jgi:hypothetical protein
MRLLTAAAAITLVLGCGGGEKEIAPRGGPLRGMKAAEADALAENVRQAPLEYLRQIHARTQQLDEYTLTFTRYERRGLFQKLHGPEEIAAWVRQDPFSVKLVWLDEDVKYGESVYIADQHDAQVRFVTRTPQPFLKAPPGINAIDPMTSVIWGESKRPLTDFGLERLMDRTLDSFNESGEDAIVEYRGIENLPITDQPVHHLRLTYSGKRHAVPLQDLYIDIRTNLPAGTELRKDDETLDAAYYYYDIDTDVDLTDESFLLSVEQSASKESGS